jgi:parallel beta-helix repeat protein
MEKGVELLRKPASIIILSLLMVSTLILAYNLRPVNSDYGWTTTIHINADGSISPPTAPIFSVDNMTYTLTDNIVGNVPAHSSAIIIQRDNITMDGAGHTLQGKNAFDSRGINMTGRSKVTIKNMKIQIFYDSIYLGSSSNNNVSGNNITANQYYGIWLGYSSNNNIVGGNNITNSRTGVWLDSSSNNNSVSGNSFVNCGMFVSGAYGNLVTGNLVNGKPLVYLEEVSNYVVGDAGQVILVDCNNITVKNLNLSHTIIGVELDETNNTAVLGNNITATYSIGIYLFSSSNNNSVSGNNVANFASGAGIAIVSSNNNSVSGNNITANNDFGIGIYLGSSSNNSIGGNNIANGNIGINLFDSSSNNNVNGNNITANSWAGIELDSSNDNTIYHNNFMNNTSQVSSSGLTNVWDNGYPSGGNYWSDYNGTDEHSGPSQTLPGYDGIGDVPYVIDGNNTDRYPFMQPLTSQGAPIVQTPTGNNVTVSPTANVTITFANVTASGFTSWDTIQPPTDQFVSVTCNDIRTNASYTGNVTLEFPYDPDGLSLQEQQVMKIWLWNDSSACWVDITTSVNTTSHTVYGVSPHLSMFGVTSNLGITGDLNVTGTTTVSIPENPPPPPSSYWLALNYYQINTTKVLLAPISLSLAYNYQSLQPGQELSIRIMMWNETSLRWVDITTGVDTTSHIVYGSAPHLSMFGVTCLQPTAGGGGGRMPYMD